MLVYLNDRLLPAGEARIPVDDRGFRYGDGLFETIPFTHGHPYQWEFHLQRMRGGLEALRIIFDTSLLAPAARELLAGNKMTDGLLRIAISRGSGGRGYLPAPDMRATLVMETLPFPASPPEKVALFLSSHHRIPPSCLPVRYKIAQGLQSTLARMEASDHSCFDALLVTPGNAVAETASANLFWLKEGRLYTPALETGALEGATRHAILRLSPWPVETGIFSLSELCNAEAVVCTNSAYGAFAIASLEPLGWQWDSIPVAQRLHELLMQDRKNTSGEWAS